MHIDLSTAEQALFETIKRCAVELSLPCWVIGGFVRDKLLGRATKDADMVCIGDGIALAHAVAATFTPTPPVSFFKTFGTAQIKLPWIELEFVGARKESYQPESRKPDVLPGTLQDDQNRRDFTINALAISLNESDYGTLIDPFDGVLHLTEKRIITPLEPAITFSDDPLRMMRGIRFASQLGFEIDFQTFQAIKAERQRIGIVSQERITDELNKIVLSPKPSVGFDLLYRSGLLHIIFPEMVALAGAEYIDGKGHKDNFYHTLQVLDNISANTNDLWLRWAAILHDIAKPVTKRFEPDIGWTFHGHEAVGGKMVPKIFNKLKLPLHEPMRYVRKLVEMHLRPIGLNKENITDSAIRRLLFDAGEQFDDLMTLCNADITSKNEKKVKRYLANFELVKQRCQLVEEKDRVRIWQPPIDGEQIMALFGLAPGRAVGVIKSALKEAMLDGEVENNYASALAFVVQKAETMGLKPKQPLNV